MQDDDDAPLSALRPGIYKPQNRNVKTENFGFFQNFRFQTESFGLFQPKIIFGLKITETFGFKTEIFDETENFKTEISGKISVLRFVNTGPYWRESASNAFALFLWPVN
jgi:hypothetical protein